MKLVRLQDSLYWTVLNAADENPVFRTRFIDTMIATPNFSKSILAKNLKALDETTV
jgi:hypothetical protein